MQAMIGGIATLFAGGILLHTLSGAVVVFSFMQPAAVEPPERETEAPKLTGTYTIVSGERDGKAIPEDEIKGAIVRFTDEKIVATDKDRKEFYSATYQLDTTKKPWAIDMTSKEPKEAKAMGLVKMDGNTLTLIYALPGGNDPTDFKTKEKQQMFVLKKVDANIRPPG